MCLLYLHLPMSNVSDIVKDLSILQADSFCFALAVFAQFLYNNRLHSCLCHNFTYMQECGPRFTLKLISLQHGTFDTKGGEYEWVHKVICLLSNTLFQFFLGLTL